MSKLELNPIELGWLTGILEGKKDEFKSPYTNKIMDKLYKLMEELK